MYNFECDLTDMARAVLKVWSSKVSNLPALDLVRSLRSVCGDFLGNVLSYSCLNIQLDSRNRLLAKILKVPADKPCQGSIKLLESLEPLELLNLPPRLFPHFTISS